MLARITINFMASGCAALLLMACTATSFAVERIEMQESGQSVFSQPGARADSSDTLVSEKSRSRQQPEIVLPDGKMTLQRAVALALIRNPQLESYSLEVRAAEAEIVEAGLWSNPEVEFEVDEFAGTGELSGTDAAELQLSLAQTFPLGGDIARRRELAGERARLAGREYDVVRVDVLTELTRRYVAVLALQRELEISEKDLQLAGDILATTRKRVEAGAAPQVEQIRARVPVAQSETRVQASRRSLESARRELALMWNQSSPEFNFVAGKLDQLREPPGRETLSNFISDNPEVALWASKISAWRAEEALARAGRIPDVTGFVGVKQLRESDENALVAGISLPLPIFDRNQGEIQALRLRKASAESKRRDVELRLERLLGATWTTLANAYEEAFALQERALPAAKEAFDLTKRAFDQGNAAFIDVLDAERTLVELRQQYVAALASYHTAIAEMEGIIGRPLHQISKNETEEK